MSDAPAQSRKWILGLDPREGAEGSLRFSAWLREALAPTVTAVVGVHAYGDMPGLAQRYVRSDELMEAAREKISQRLQRAGAEPWLEDVEFSTGRDVAAILEAATQRHKADFVAIGRSAPREGRTLLRLGSTARRLLRRLPGPVIVVPPDFTPPPEAGPVLIATNLGPESEAALRFGAQLARQTGRSARAVYCLEEHHAAQYIPQTRLAQLSIDRAAKAREKLTEWLESLGVDVDAQDVLTGDAVESLVKHARTTEAALVVCGSRRLSLTVRLLLTSAGSELAAFAPCPVAVVPPE